MRFVNKQALSVLSGVDNLFSFPLPMSNPQSQTPAVSSSSVEATPDAAPASKTKKTKVAKKKKKKSANKGPTDEQLFGNTDDIFGGIPEAKQTTPKTKKKKKASGEAAVVGDTHADTGERVLETLTH